jgi:hypothetical protein
LKSSAKADKLPKEDKAFYLDDVQDTVSIKKVKLERWMIV